MSNKEVASIFKLLAGLMELHNENPFKSKSYANAAFIIGRLPGNVMEMGEVELEKAQGIGKSIAAKIVELKNTNTMEALEELLAKTPEGIVEMMQIKGLGGKKVAVIWNELGIESIGELLYACYENRLVKLKGFGDKTQESIIKTIEYYQSNIGKFHFATIDKLSQLIVESLQKILKTNYVSLCSDVRRKCNIIESVDLVVGITKQEFEGKFNAIDFLHDWNFTNENSCTAITTDNVPVKICFAEKENFIVKVFELTGNVDHVQYVKSKFIDWPAQVNNEQEIYLQAGLNFIPAEMRDLPISDVPFNSYDSNSLIELTDIKGVVHNHSTWSDGRNTLEEMALACINAGYSYLVISDHSKTAVYAGGLSIEQVLAQHQQIDELNKKFAPFKILKSIESDILNDGSLDYSDEILKQFDLVIASVHQNLRMDFDRATNRLLKAIENPHTTILGHMTGRLLLSRPGYPVDHKKIIDACAANQIIIEINANPYRLDIDFIWIPYAMQKDVFISINPDAHSVEGIHDIYYGVCSARKGGLLKEYTWNTFTLPQVEEYLTKRKQQKGIL